MPTTIPPGADVLQRMDAAKLSRFHWKIMFISGMGFFTDAYDLFIIGVVMALLKQEWGISPTEEGLVASTALLASAVGAVLFGRIADMLGRKRIYGYEVLVLAVGAVASAFSPNIWWLIVFRIILGVGTGGDYPVSSTIMSEYASKRTRGMMVTLVFTMQAAGLIFGPLLAAALLWTRLSHDVIWRILLAFGAIPAMSVFWLRRHMAETPRYLLATGQRDAFGEAATHVLGQMDGGERRKGRVSDAAPGYLIAAATIDRIGRKSIQMVGFVMMAVTFGAMAFIPDVEKLLLPFLIIYGVSYFFTEFGPNSTTFVYPAEIFPVRARTTGHGIAAATGKLGGFFGVFLFPILMAWKGMTAAEAAAATVSVLGAIVTLTMLPETKGLSLEELSPEAAANAQP